MTFRQARSPPRQAAFAGNSAFRNLMRSPMTTSGTCQDQVQLTAPDPLGILKTASLLSLHCQGTPWIFG